MASPLIEWCDTHKKSESFLWDMKQNVPNIIIHVCEKKNPLKVTWSTESILTTFSELQQYNVAMLT